MITIGILALQGDYLEFSEGFERNVEIADEDIAVQIVTNHDDLKEIDGLVIPGGESTVIGRLLTKTIAHTEGKETLLDAIKKKITQGMPVLGVCAGAILLAKKIRDVNLGEIKQPHIGTLDINIERNSYGRQNLSFEARIEYPDKPEEKETGIFIRAPRILSVGSDINAIAKLDQEIVAVLKENQFATIFHPELEHESLILRRFIETVAAYKAS